MLKSSGNSENIIEKKSMPIDANRCQSMPIDVDGIQKILKFESKISGDPSLCLEWKCEQVIFCDSL